MNRNRNRSAYPRYSLGLFSEAPSFGFSYDFLLFYSLSNMYMWGSITLSGSGSRPLSHLCLTILSHKSPNGKGWEGAC